MNPASVTFKRLKINASVPQRHSSGAAGYDVCSLESGVIPPHSLVSVKTGFSLSIPYEFLGILMGRSGLALKNGLEIKPSYVKNNEEVVVHIYNTSNNEFEYTAGMRIAQLMFAKVDNSELVLEN
ncbi:dUTP pyrophosphatase [Enteropsectra breve]|nr:dUTP pyrophosphatase [Enteropsectra breve]